MLQRVVQSLLLLSRAGSHEAAEESTSLHSLASFHDSDICSSAPSCQTCPSAGNQAGKFTASGLTSCEPGRNRVEVTVPETRLSSRICCSLQSRGCKTASEKSWAIAPGSAVMTLKLLCLWGGARDALISLKKILSEGV